MLALYASTTMYFQWNYQDVLEVYQNIFIVILISATNLHAILAVSKKYKKYKTIRDEVENSHTAQNLIVHEDTIAHVDIYCTVNSKFHCRWLGGI